MFLNFIKFDMFLIQEFITQRANWSIIQIEIVLKILIHHLLVLLFFFLIMCFFVCERNKNRKREREREIFGNSQRHNEIVRKRIMPMEIHSLYFLENSLTHWYL